MGSCLSIFRKKSPNVPATTKTESLSSEEQQKSPIIPVIDFLSWTSPTSGSAEDRLRTARELVKACHTSGFVYIKNHGVAPEVLEEAFAMTKKFFALPLDQKMTAANKGMMSFRGYSWPGLENVGANGEEVMAPESTESYAFGSDNYKRDVNVWPAPTLLPGFQPFFTRFYGQCWRTTQLILKAVALGLDLPSEDFLLDVHDPNEQQVTVRHYPPVSAKTLEQRKMRRLGRHSDFDSFTLLFQDDCGGLEVEKQAEKDVFLPVDPIEGTLVMNIGDALEQWSNDYLRSTKHRVQLPPLEDRYTGEERMTRERYSIPYFVVPRMDTVINCLPGCSSAENPSKYESMVFEQWMREKTAKVFVGDTIAQSPQIDFLGIDLYT